MPGACDARRRTRAFMERSHASNTPLMQSVPPDIGSSELVAAAGPLKMLGSSLKAGMKGAVVHDPSMAYCQPPSTSHLRTKGPGSPNAAKNPHGPRSCSDDFSELNAATTSLP